MSSTTTRIHVEGVAKYFGRVAALRDVRLNVEQGQFVSLFGRNGAGKSTLLRILAGLSQPSEGTVRFHVPQPLAPRAARGRLGYLSHNTALYGDLTALENLRFYARLQELPGDDGALKERIRRVGLAGREHDPVRNYSRGMQQRLAIARAFLHDPDVLLLDEPFTGLDQDGSHFLKRYLSDAHARGKTCVMAIHDAAIGYELADRMVVIDRGIVALDLQPSSISLEAFQQRYGALAREQ